MCLLCGEASFGRHAISMTERPAHRLAGLWWEGTYAEAAGGATRAALAAVKDVSDSRDTLWKSPIVGLSWSQGENGLRYFCGIAIEADEAVSAGFSIIDLPSTEFAGSWHGPDDADVVSHLGRILEWLRLQGLSWDRTHCEQREEYAPDVDLDAPPALRLMLPVTRSLDERDA
jgi:predicted transcriptional regulator YdeE